MSPSVDPFTRAPVAAAAADGAAAVDPANRLLKLCKKDERQHSVSGNTTKRSGGEDSRERERAKADLAKAGRFFLQPRVGHEGRERESESELEESVSRTRESRESLGDRELGARE